MRINQMKVKYMIMLLTLTAVMPLQAESVDTIAKVLAKKGDVKILTGTKVKDAKRKSSLIEFDTIITSTNAQTSVKFNDGTITTLGSDSEMLIKEYKWSPNDKHPIVELELVNGVFRTVTGLATKVLNPNFNVATPLGSIGIRGTDFFGGFLDSDALDILFVGGKHEIVVSNSFGTTVLTSPGQGTTIKAGEAPSAAKVWPKEKVDRAMSASTFVEGSNSSPVNSCNCPCDQQEF